MFGKTGITDLNDNKQISQISNGKLEAYLMRKQFKRTSKSMTLDISELANGAAR